MPPFERRSIMHRGQQLSLIGAIGLLVGAFLPWVTVSAALFGLSISKAGYEGDGIFTAGIGFIILLGSILYKGKPGRIYSIGTAVLSFIALALLIYTMTNLSSLGDEIEAGVFTSVGPGIYVSVIGALIGIVGGFLRVPDIPENEPPSNP
jgi:hypothetical protein